MLRSTATHALSSSCLPPAPTSPQSVNTTGRGRRATKTMLHARQPRAFRSCGVCGRCTALMNSASRGHAAASAALIIAGSDISEAKCTCGTRTADTCYYCRHGCGGRFVGLCLRSHENKCAHGQAGGNCRVLRPPKSQVGAVCRGHPQGVGCLTRSRRSAVGLGSALGRRSGCGTGPMAWVRHWVDGLHMDVPCAGFSG